MRKTVGLAISILIVCACCISIVNAGKPPMALLHEYDVSLHLVTQLFFGDEDNYSYRVEQTMTMSGEAEEGKQKKETEVSVFTYDPTQPDGAKAKLLKVDGNPPTEKQLERFNDVYNDTEDKTEVPHNAFLTESAKVVENNDKELIVECDFNPRKLADDDEDLKHSRLRIVVDKSLGQLRKIEVRSFEPFRKMLVAKVLEFNVDVWIKKHPETSDYLPEKSRMYVKTKAMGMDMVMEEISEFGDYQKIKTGPEQSRPVD